MTTLQIIAILATPVAALAMAGILAYVVRRETSHGHHHPAE